LVPMLEETLLKPVAGETSDASDTSSNDSNSETVSKPLPDESSNSNDPVKYKTFSCLFLARNSQNDVCSATYISVSEETKTYLVCRFPVEMNLDNSGRPVPMYDILGIQNVTFSQNKMSSLVGSEIPNYIVIDEGGLKKLAGLKKGMTIDLPYEIKYLNPEYAGIPEELLGDEHYITITPGKIVLDENNIGMIFNSIKDENIIDYSFQQTMCLSILKQFSSSKAYATDLIIQKKLFDSVETNIQYKDIAELAKLFFALGEYKEVNMVYPTTYEFTAPDVILPNWDAGIKQINRVGK
ncbi:MAG: hypothetical protein RRY76_01190, partial [Clostridia bacterium]